MFHVKQTPLNCVIKGSTIKRDKTMYSKKLFDFGSDWILILDSQDVNIIVEPLNLVKHTITGLIVAIYDDDNVEVWATESSTPYLLTSEYMPIDYWRNCD